MRLLSLDLERFGPFTGTKLQFRPDAKLHVVYGPNEAGKSSALAAIFDLLFGFGHSTTYDFLHEPKSLRVGAEIQSSSGQRLAFRRRKGNKSTLIDANDAPLRDDALSPYLGSLTRDVFCRAFGLDAPALRSGADAILSSQGDVGATLLAAAAGLRDLNNLVGTINREAEAIFAPKRAKDRLFYQALDRFESARKTIAASELRTPDWKKLNEDIGAAGEALKANAAERRDLAARRSRLERLKRVAPLVRGLDVQVQALAELEHLPTTKPDFLRRLDAALDLRTQGNAALLRARREFDEARGEHQSSEVDEVILTHAVEIERLVQAVVNYQVQQRDLPRVQVEVDDYEAKLARHAIALGLADAASLESSQPTAGALKLVELQIDEGRDLLADKIATRKAIDAAETERGDLERERDAGTPPLDPASLREQYAALGALAPQVAQHETLAREIKLEAGKLAELAARLDPPVLDLDAMARTSLPGAESVARARKSLDESSKAIARAEDRLASARDAEAKARRRLTSLAAGRPVPSAERIAQARSDREASFAVLAACLLAPADLATFDLTLADLALADRPAAIARHEALVREADALVDEARRDAQRVADHASAAEDHAEHARSLDLAQNEKAAALQARNVAELAWQSLWDKAGIEARPPEDMAAWTTGLNALLERRERLEGQKLTAETQAATLAAALPGVLALSRQAGLPDLDGLDLVRALGRLDKRVASLEEQWNKVRDREARLGGIALRIEKLGAAEAVNAGHIADWKARWSKSLRDIGLTGTEGIEQAEAALAVWKVVPDTLSQRENRSKRIRGLRRDTMKFAEEANALVAIVAPDLARLPPDAAIKSLPDRLAKARNAETRREEAGKRLKRAADALAAAERNLLAGAAEIDALIATLPGPIEDLALLRDGLKRRAELADKLDQSRAHLAAMSDGIGESELRGELDSFDPDAAEAELRDIATREERLEAGGQEIYSGQQRLIEKKVLLEGGTGAELAMQERRSAEAELTAAARDYSVLRIGALLLGSALERHRAGRQDPLMQRAGALFGDLTGAAWSGLDQEFDLNDRAELKARRADGRLVELEHLSEGTRDQLYLALRLAYLENYAERAEPAPFIGDDLFASFDDDRTARGLSALAAIGERVQPLLFTHHRHVADIAAAHLGAVVDIVELG